jgi:tyrosyl-tRNA synthetase
LTTEELDTNVKGITAQVNRFFERGMEYAERRGFGQGVEGGGGVEVVNNLDWTKGLGMLEFLRTVGKVARVNIMLSRDRYVQDFFPLDEAQRVETNPSVKNRLSSESGISFTEFSYQLLQAYDFHHLNSEKGCTIQIGGSDQWGNIVAGIDLIKSLNKGGSIASVQEGQVKEDEGKEVQAYGMTIPLLTTSNGEKFGKSAGNAVWLDEGRTGISDFYQVSPMRPSGRLLLLRDGHRYEEPGHS